MITGVRISEVQAKRDSEEMITNMKFNINFDDVKINGENVEVMYTFIATYETGEPTKAKQIGELKIVGTVLSKEDKKGVEEITKKWEEMDVKTKQPRHTLPLAFAENIINLLNFECGARGTLLASSIGLLAPIPLSRAKLQETPQGKSA